MIHETTATQEPRIEAFTFGAAMQIATSFFHASNHNLNFTARYTF